MSKKLNEVSHDNEVRYNPVKEQNFVSWDSQNKFKTSYTNMHCNEQKLVNLHYIPKHSSFVPRVKSENLFGRNSTKCADFGARKFDEIRFSGKDSDNYKE